jgi:hypothetical protein
LTQFAKIFGDVGIENTIAHQGGEDGLGRLNVKWNGHE